MKCIGILREVKKRKNGGESTLMNYEFEILYVTPLEDELNLEDFDEKEIGEIKNVCKQINNDGLNVLTESFAP